MYKRQVEGYAREIRELRKKRNQLMEAPNQKMDDGQTKLRELPNINTDSDRTRITDVDKQPHTTTLFSSVSY